MNDYITGRLTKLPEVLTVNASLFPQRTMYSFHPSALLGFRLGQAMTFLGCISGQFIKAYLQSLCE